MEEIKLGPSLNRINTGYFCLLSKNLIHNRNTDPKKANMYRRNLRLDDEMQPAAETLLLVKPKTEALQEVLKGKFFECV